MATKSDLVTSALNKLAVNGFDYEVDPAEVEAGVIALEYLMAAWDALGIKIGYSFASDPETADATAQSGLPDIAFRAVTYALAIDLADSYGKAVTQSVALGASSGMTALLNAIQQVPVVQYTSRMPVGSGNRGYGSQQFQRFYRPVTQLDADNAGPIDTSNDGIIQP